MNPRRLVTGHDASGNAVVVSDEIVEPITLGLLPGYEWHALSGDDGPRDFPNDGSECRTGAYFPPVGGYRFTLFTIPPDGGTPAP